MEYSLKVINSDVEPTLEGVLFTQKILLTHNLGSLVNVLEHEETITELYKEILSPALERARSHDYVAVRVSHPKLKRLNYLREFYITYAKKKNIDYAAFVQQIYKISQSQEAGERHFLSSTIDKPAELTFAVDVVRNRKHP